MSGEGWGAHIHSIYGTCNRGRRRNMKKLMIGLVWIFSGFFSFPWNIPSSTKGICRGVQLHLVWASSFRRYCHSAGSGTYQPRWLTKKVLRFREKNISVKPVFYDSKYIPAESVLNLEKMLTGGIKFIYSRVPVSRFPSWKRRPRQKFS